MRHSGESNATEGGGRVAANVASREVLDAFREAFTVDDARAFSRRQGPAYSVANMFCGAGGDLLTAIRALFKSIWACDTEKAFRAIYMDISGSLCYASVDDMPWEKVRGPTFLIITPPCPDYSSGSPCPEGEHGTKGGQFFVQVPTYVKKLNPAAVLIEEVGNLINFEDELMKVLWGLQNDCGMAVHASLVSMQQYGDIEHKWRIPIVGLSHAWLGHWAVAYRMPMGQFSDAVSYCGEDIATATEEIPERYKRFMRDYPVVLRSHLPGDLQKVGQVAPGQGFSQRPHAVYSLQGVHPAATTYAAGRHLPFGWRQGTHWGNHTCSCLRRWRRRKISVLMW